MAPHSDSTAAPSPPPRRSVAVGLALLAFALPVALHLHLASGDALYFGLDAAHVNLPRFEILGRALRDERSFPLWQSWILGGTPFHANPENPTLYPPVVALAALCPPLLAANLTVLLHLGLGALGAYLLCLALWRREAAASDGGGEAGALLAALLFGLSHFLRLDHLNLVVYGAAHALAPWIFLAADGLLFGRAPRRAAGALALLIALQVFTGGLFVIAYTAVGLALFLALRGGLGGREARARLLRLGSLAGVAAALLIAAKALPAWEWLATTNRSGALDYEVARGLSLGGRGEREASEVARRVSLYLGGWLPVALAALALCSLRRAAVRFALVAALVGFLVALGPLHRVLYDFVPPFDRIRSGSIRGWTLVALWLPVAAGLGTQHAAAFCARRAGRRWIALALPLVLAAVQLPLLLDSDWMNPTLRNPGSRAEILARHPNWAEAAERARAGEGPGERVAYLEGARIGPRTEQLLTTSLGLEGVNGFLGYAWPPELERHVFQVAGEAPLARAVRLKRLGVLSVGVVVEGRRPKREVLTGAPGEELYPADVDGRRASANPHARPRAFLPEVVVGVLGDCDEDTARALFDDPAFDPTRMAAVQLGEEPGEAAPAVDAYLVLDGAAAPDGAVVVRASQPLDAEGRRALGGLLAGLAGAQPAGAGELERDGANALRIRLPQPADRARFLVVSEPWCFHPAWRVEVDGAAVRPARADGVASAVLLPAGAAVVEARYAPASAQLGFGLGAAGLLLALGLLLPPRRRAESAG
ncbi:MAG: hypothetical protein AAF682_14170 [Planctomycetota bacterium]